MCMNLKLYIVQINRLDSLFVLNIRSYCCDDVKLNY